MREKNPSMEFANKTALAYSAVGGDEQPRRLLELPVRRERHPECAHVAGLRGRQGFVFVAKTARRQGVGGYRAHWGRALAAGATKTYQC